MTTKANVEQEMSELVARARSEHRQAIRTIQRVKQRGVYGPDNVHAIAMPRFVSKNLMTAARRLRTSI